MPVTTKAIRYVLGILTGKTAYYIKGWNDCHMLAKNMKRLWASRYSPGFEPALPQRIEAAA